MRNSKPPGRTAFGRISPKTRPWAAALSGLISTTAIAAEPPPEDVGVDQIMPSPAAADAEQIKPKTPDTGALALDQLPESLEPGKNANEGQLEKGIAPARTLTGDVIAAWSIIRDRGQTPTPDLIAREIGPDKLAEFLASHPAAGSVLATGIEPDGQVQTDPESRPDGVVVSPPGSGQ